MLLEKKNFNSVKELVQHQSYAEAANILSKQGFTTISGLPLSHREVSGFLVGNGYQKRFYPNRVTSRGFKSPKRAMVKTPKQIKPINTIAQDITLLINTDLPRDLKLRLIERCL